MSTYMAKAGEVARKWYIIDAAGKPLGRVAAQAAVLLRGKHKPEFTPHVDCGDHVIIINCAKAVLTGKKLEQKKWYRHTGWNWRPEGSQVFHPDGAAPRKGDGACRDRHDPEQHHRPRRLHSPSRLCRHGACPCRAEARSVRVLRKEAKQDGLQYQTVFLWHRQKKELGGPRPPVCRHRHDQHQRPADRRLFRA